MVFHSSIEPIYYLLPLIGFAVGLLGTILGSGGGFFFLAILTLLLGVQAQTAVVTSLVATLPVCFVGSLGHFHKGNIDFRTGALFALAGIIGAFIGAGITSKISAEQLKVSFGIYSVIIALNIAFSTRKKKQLEVLNPVKQRPSGFLKIAKGSFFGFFAGIITGAFGTSGAAPVLAGLFTMHMPLKLVIGTSLMVVLVNTIFAVGAHFWVGTIDLTLVYFLTAGSLIGALLAPKILTKAKTDNSENKIRYIYAAVLVAIGLLMIIVA